MIDTTSLPLLLEPEQLHATLGNKKLLTLDVSHSDNYTRHHIPNAVHISPSALQCGQPPAPGKLPDTERLTQLFSSVGLSDDRHVVVCDDEGGGWAGRLIWTLDVLGHTRYSYLNGGLHAWVNEGYPTETVTHPIATTEFLVNINPDPIATLGQVLAALDDPGTAIWDARSPQEYNGSRAAARRAGHIPGAINIDWINLIDRQRNMRLVDLARLQAQLNQCGLSKDKCIITHCQTHHRSGLSYLAMKILGYPHIKGYDGSWAEWGNRDDTPIER